MYLRFNSHGLTDDPVKVARKRNDPSITTSTRYAENDCTIIIAVCYQMKIGDVNTTGMATAFDGHTVYPVAAYPAPMATMF